MAMGEPGMDNLVCCERLKMELMVNLEQVVMDDENLKTDCSTLFLRFVGWMMEGRDRMDSSD